MSPLYVGPFDGSINWNAGRHGGPQESATAHTSNDWPIGEDTNDAHGWVTVTANWQPWTQDSPPAENHDVEVELKFEIREGDDVKVSVNQPPLSIKADATRKGTAMIHTGGTYPDYFDVTLTIVNERLPYIA